MAVSSHRLPDKDHEASYDNTIVDHRSDPCRIVVPYWQHMYRDTWSLINLSENVEMLFLVGNAPLVNGSSVSIIMVLIWNVQENKDEDNFWN